MASDRYDPSEASIAECLARTGGDQRKLAIAYLRAQKRAREAETAFRVMDGVAGMATSVMSGDAEGAKLAADKAMRSLRTHNEAGGC